MGDTTRVNAGCSHHSRSDYDRSTRRGSGTQCSNSQDLHLPVDEIDSSADSAVAVPAESSDVHSRKTTFNVRPIKE